MGALDDARTDCHVDNAVEIRPEQPHEEREALGPRQQELTPERVTAPARVSWSRLVQMRYKLRSGSQSRGPDSSLMCTPLVKQRVHARSDVGKCFEERNRGGVSGARAHFGASSPSFFAASSVRCLPFSWRHKSEAPSAERGQRRALWRRHGLLNCFCCCMKIVMGAGYKENR